MIHISELSQHFGKGSIIVIVITLILFIVALFVKGFTHELLLEIAIFLVSVKLILITYSNSVSSKNLEKKIEELDAKLDMLIAKE